MQEANPGKDPKDWKPPAGYKSALAKARDAARAQDKKTGPARPARRPVASTIPTHLSGEDSASEDGDDAYSQIDGQSLSTWVQSQLSHLLFQSREVDLGRTLR